MKNKQIKKKVIVAGSITATVIAIASIAIAIKNKGILGYIK